MQEHPGWEDVLSVAVCEVPHYGVTQVVTVDPQLMSPACDGGQEHLGGRLAPEHTPL